MASPVDFADKVGHRFSVSLGERAESSQNASSSEMLVR